MPTSGSVELTLTQYPEEEADSPFLWRTRDIRFLFAVNLLQSSACPSTNQPSIFADGGAFFKTGAGASLSPQQVPRLQIASVERDFQVRRQRQVASAVR